VFLGFENGLINELLMALGFIDQPIFFLAESSYSWGILTFANVWKTLGWNAIIYIAAIAGINGELYDAVRVDGASRFGRIRHVTLPGVLPTITVVMLMNAGWILNTGFDQYYLLGNSMTLSYTDVIDTYTIRYGMEQGLLSYATAIGVFRSAISLAILFLVNGFARRFTDNSLF
jgi:putative aldouronate transport system permease protein